MVRSCRYPLLRYEIAAVAILTLGLVGCSGGSALNGHPAATLFGSGTATTANGAGHGGSSSASSKGRPSRPGSVSGIFKSIPFELPCPAGSTVWVAAGTTTTTFTIEELDSQSVCFSGLEASSSPTLFVITPSGVRRNVDIHPEGSMWEWVLDPGPGHGAVHTIGQYGFELLTSTPSGDGSTAPDTSESASSSFTPSASSSAVSPTATASNTSLAANLSAPIEQRAAVSHSSVSSSGRFTVVRPSKPVAESINDGLSAGNQLLVSLAGFPSNSAVFLTIYGPGAFDTRTFPLFLDLPVLVTNTNGEALVQWTVPAGAAAGYYGILVNPPPPPCSSLAACLPFRIDS